MNFSFRRNTTSRNVILHIAVWAGIFSLIFFLESVSIRPNILGQDKMVLTTFRAVSVLVLAIVFYINVYFLLPRTKTAKQWVLFVVLQLVLLCLYVNGVDYAFSNLTNNILIRPLRPPPMEFPGFNKMPGGLQTKFFIRRGMPFNWITIFPFALAVTASLAFYYILESFKLDKQKKELKLISLASELQFLKSQVSPHFLFNVLNSLTFLARKKSEILEPALIKLSSLLRYMLYETDVNGTSLDKEISYLTDYIELQQLRYHELNVKSNFQNNNEQAVIAPMLLIPFVENAFKHTAAQEITDAFIEINLYVHENQLHFSVINSCSATKPEQADKASGIGLTNVAKRLEILYPESHHLTIQKSDNRFIVSLEIKLETLL